MNEAMVHAIIRYIDNIDDFLFDPDEKRPAYWFDKRSYSLWAAEEVLRLVMDHPAEPPTMIAEAFMLNMTYLSGVAKSKEARFIFMFAMYSSGNILDMLRAME